MSVAWKFFDSQSRKVWMCCKKRVSEGAAASGSGTGWKMGGAVCVCGAEAVGWLVCGRGGTDEVGGVCCSATGADSVGWGKSATTPADMKPTNAASKPGSVADRWAGATGRRSCSARRRTSEGSSHGLTGSISGAGNWPWRGILPALLALPREVNRRLSPRLCHFPMLQQAALLHWHE